MAKKSILFLSIFLLLIFFLISCSPSLDKNEPLLNSRTGVNAGVDLGNKVLENKVQDKPFQSSSENPVVRLPSGTSVFINSQELTQFQIQELTTAFGKAPLPGNYWYDSLSGFYGILYGPTLGLLSPGYHFGTLATDASKGSTGVFINGRNLPEIDAIALETLFAIQRKPGRYWMDGQGNIGVEGDTLPLVNLYVAYAQVSRNRSGGSGSKDNYWAGNFGSYGNEQNGFGYVMVDGASVSYGS